MTVPVSELVVLLAVLAASAAAVAAGAALLSRRGRPAPGGTPTASPPPPAALPVEAQVEQALQPYLFAGICAAYRVGEWAMDRVGRRLRGTDKQAVAAAVYRLLPDRIGEFDVTVVKRLVPPARFARLVQDAFDRFDEQFMRSQARYQELFRAWVADYRSAARPRRPAPAPAPAPRRDPEPAPPPSPPAAGPADDGRPAAGPSTPRGGAA
jgi:pyruvate/2-oxoglutarate dehydrogenase complex dihydrolipoamide acyltransferase (E2) component